MAEETKDTPEKESVDWEKRYKDLQSHSTGVEKKVKTLEEDSLKDKQLLQDLSPFVDWTAASGTKEEENGDELVAKKELTTQIATLRREINANKGLQDFRVKHPDMIQYEDLVTMYIAKTDNRKTTEARIEEAVELTRKFLDAEHSKVKDVKEEVVKDKIAKEAEASGFETTGSQPEQEEKDETYEDYVAGRKAQGAKARGE